MSSVQQEMAMGGDGGRINEAATEVTLNHALDYLKDVKREFQHKKGAYQEFYKVMMDFKSKRITTCDVVAKMKKLFKDHKHLLLRFNMFLPEGKEITFSLEDEPSSNKPLLFQEAVIFVNKIKDKCQGNYRMYNAFLDILSKYRLRTKSVTDVHREIAILFQEHGDIIDEFRHFLPGDPRSDSLNMTSPKSSEPRDNNPNTPSIRQHNAEKEGIPQTPINRDSTNVKNDKPKKRVRGSEDRVSDYVTSQQTSYSNQILCETMMKKLPTPEIYQEFMRCIHLYTKGVLNRQELKSMVSDLLYEDSLLMDSFGKFLDQCDIKDSTLDVRLGKRKNIVSNEEKYQSKPISEIDFTNTERCSPSYRLLPNDYPIPHASNRTASDSLVLNDHWILVASETQFKHKKKSQYEEALFYCEEDRFEMDMLLESLTATTKSVVELLKFLSQRYYKRGDSFQLRDHLTVSNVRCIERLYGDQALDVIHVLEKNALLALPVVLTRLRQKHGEWQRCRDDYNLLWADIYSQNHRKFFDDNCSSFRIKDGTSLKTKALLAEIKDIRARKKDDDPVEFCSCGKQCSPPHFVFDFPDAEIHRDIYEIIKYSCEGKSTNEQFVRVMKIWSCFMEPIISWSPRGTDPGDVDDRQQKFREFGCHHSGKNIRIFYGNDSFYLLFRFFQILYKRVRSAKSSSRSKDHYTKFLMALLKLLDGSSDNAKFEDACKRVIGPNSYILFTLDKLMSKIIKLMQRMASEEVNSKLLELHACEKSRSGFVDSLYHERARAILSSDALYRFQSVFCQSSLTLPRNYDSLVLQCSSSTRVSVWLIDGGHGFPGVSTNELLAP